MANPKTTNALYKLLPSVLNVILTFILSSPFLLLFGPSLTWRTAWITVFFLYNLIFEFLYQRRDPGMIIFSTYYERQRTPKEELLYVLLYTISFSTLLFHLWFPFDLLLINLIAFQLPFVLRTGNTFHGYIAGNIRTVRKSEAHLPH